MFSSKNYLILIPKVSVLFGICAALLTDISHSASGPNILILLADDLGYSDLSCFGSQQVSTPHLDKLASEGIRFTDFYAASAVCSPSRACLLTGRFSVRTGVYSWIHTSQKMHLRDEEVTIAELLKEKNYQTAHIGKWHLGYQLVEGSGPQPNPNDQGFDYWMATGNNANPSHENPDNFVRNGKMVGPTNGYSSQLVVEESINWLDNERDKNHPFYLNLWFHEPHARVAAPEKFRQRHLDTSRPDYYGCIENMDDAIGKILKKISDDGLDKNTLIIFSSDNGSYVPGSNGILKGKKTQLWEGGIREPAIMKWPGKITQGTKSSVPCGLVDILPTVCAAANVGLPQDRVIDGVSLLPIFENNDLNRQTPLYWFYHPSRPVCVIRIGDFSLTADPSIPLSRANMFKESSIGDIKKTDLTNFRLYDLKHDPGQQHDLSSERPELLSQMKKKMLRIHRSVMNEAYDWRSSN